MTRSRWATGWRYSSSRTGANRDAIGAWVEVTAGDRVMRREVTVGGGHAGGQLGWIHFGLGDAESASVRVIWPDGERGPAMAATADTFGIIDARLDRDRALDAAAMTARGAAVGARLEAVTLPDFGMPAAMPELPTALYADRLARLRERRGRGGLPAPGDLRRSRAQRQPGLSDRLRPALRGGRADRGAGWRSGGPGRQRVLGHGRRGAAADAAPSVPGPEPAEPAARPIGAAGRHPGRGGHRSGGPGGHHRLEDLCPSGAERRALLSGRCAARRSRGRAARSRTPPAC